MHVAASALTLITGTMFASANDAVHCGVEMRNVALHASDGVILHVRALDGEFVSHAANQPPVFDDPKSYTVRIRSADIAIDVASLNALFRQSIASRPSPITDVTLVFEEGKLRANGKLHKGITVPFSMTASVGASRDGMIRLHSEKMKAVGVPVKGLLDLLGLDVADLMKMPPGSGIRAEGDDLLLDPTALLPPPRMEGRVQTVAVNGNRMVMRMIGGAAPPKRPATLPSPSSRNYLYFYGGSIRFGKLTMSDADMQLIDADPSTPFDFYPARYEDQLVAGYSKNTRRKGLQVFMPDYSRVAAKGGMLKPARLP